jgi:hypothetical protein
VGLPLESISHGLNIALLKTAMILELKMVIESRYEALGCLLTV